MLPLLGVTMEKKLFVMVSEWMENGNINEFVRKHTNVDRLELVCSLFKALIFHVSSITLLFQLRDATMGLIYMHDQGVIHGDLKGVCVQTCISSYVS